MSVIDARWRFNCKLNGTGPFLYDLAAPDPFDRNVADEHPETTKELFALALEDASGEVPGWVLKLADEATDAPGCSALAARE